MNIIDIEGLKIHPLANTNPPMSSALYEGFKLDVAQNGQLVPVILYRGKLVDGRHRLKALKAAGRSTIKVEHLPNNMSLDEVAKVIKSTETRRHQSPTQLAIRAYYYWKGGMKQEEALVASGASKTNLAYVINIVKMGRLDIIDLLVEGEKFDVSRSSYSKPTESLSAIVAYLKEQTHFLDVALGRTVENEETEKQKISTSHKATLDAIEAMVATLPKELIKVAVARIYSLGKEQV